MSHDEPLLKARVRAFWEEAPLFTGESSEPAGTRAFFEQHESVVRAEGFPGGLDPARYFPFAERASVLDVGCGPGFWTRELARRSFRTTAIDLTDAAVALARNSLTVFSLDADVQQADAEALPFADSCFDGVVSHGVIHHTPDTMRCVQEIARVLRPGGRAVVSVYYRNFVLRSPLLSRLASVLLRSNVSLKGRGRDGALIVGDAEEIVRRYDGADNPIGKAYTRTEFVSLLSESGLEVEEVWRYYFPLRALGQLGDLLRPAGPILSRAGGLMIAARARKG